MQRISPALRFLRGALLMALLLPLCAAAQSFSIPQTPIEVAVTPGFDPLPLKLAVTSTAPAFNVTNLQVTSDAPWVQARVDEKTNAIVLTFWTSNLVSRYYTATVTARSATMTNVAFVRANVAPLKVVKLLDDPRRSRTYGLHDAGTNSGAVLVFNPLTGESIGSLTVGGSPSDMDLSFDGRELVVMNSGSRSISVLDVVEMRLKETFSLNEFVAYDEFRTAHVAAGPGDIIYYTDHDWAPSLRVFDRKSGTVLQSTRTANDFGFGDLVLSPDGKNLYAWTQYGWSAGSADTFVVRYAVQTNGTLSFVERTAGEYTDSLARDPLNSPSLITQDGETLFIKGKAFAAGAITNAARAFRTVVYSISPGGEIFMNDRAIYDAASGLKLRDLPKTTTVQTISSDYTRFIYFDSAALAIKTLDLAEILADNYLNRKVTPAPGAITLGPTRLEWSNVPGADRFRVYLGTSEAEVASAGTNSALFLGETVGFVMPLAMTFLPGTNYYWRVDPVTEFEVLPGRVMQFTVSVISSSTNALRATTVKGDRSFPLEVEITAQAASEWQVSADQPWVKFVATNGTTPSKLKLLLDTTLTTSNVSRANVHLQSGGKVVLTLPVTLTVEPLNLTVMRSDPASVFAYGISEDKTVTPSRAYLLRINALTEAIERAVPVGSDVTDIAIHNADRRIYIANWSSGRLLGLNLESLLLERTYDFTPGSYGYVDRDVYRISAGAAGRLMVEEMDQWIEISLYDTIKGTNLARYHLREGGGGFDPTGRFYYHGENNSSGAELRKFSVTGDEFAAMGSARVTSGGYYGSRTVVVSELGNRVFWNGGVFDENLAVVWDCGVIFYAASKDGRLAFGESACYDVVSRVTVTNLEPTKVKAFNTVTDKLVYQRTNGMAFLQFNGSDKVTPDDGGIVSSPPVLQWKATPTATEYHVYFGRALEDVADGGTNSSAFIGAQNAVWINLPDSLQSGNYYWRVDAVTAYGIIKGTVHSFLVSPVAPNQVAIDALTFPGFPAKTTLELEAAPGLNWSIKTDADWVSLSRTNGQGNGQVELTMLPGSDSPSTSLTATLIVSDSTGVLFRIPVRLVIQPLNVTFLKSMPGSGTVYAISETNRDGFTQAYLLELDSDAEAIRRVVPVGSFVSDLALHNAERRIYVPNWKEGKLLAVSMETFQVERTYEFRDVDVYRVAAGATGRLVIEGRDQWIGMYLLDTAAGTVIRSVYSVREGGGVFDPTGRFYYHVDNNISDASIRQYEMTGDMFQPVNSRRGTTLNYYGSRTVVAAEDGTRLYWNGASYSAALDQIQTYQDEIRATSTNGAIALSRTRVYFNSNTPALGMPVDTDVSTFNSVTRKIVVQKGNRFGFYSLAEPLTFPAPVIFTNAVGATFVTLSWTDNSLEQGFSIQHRRVGTDQWQDAGTTARNVTDFTVTGLTPKTSYEFRVKADSKVVSSAWSQVVSLTTRGTPPGTPTLYTPLAVSGTVLLQWSLSGETSSIIIERAVNWGTNWLVIAETGTNRLTYEDWDVVSLTNYSYRIKAKNDQGESPYSSIRTAQVPVPMPPGAPTFISANSIMTGGVLVSWGDVLGETGYRLERRTDGPGNWIEVGVLTTNRTTFEDTNVVAGIEYFYRVQAFNAFGNSPYSPTASVIPQALVVVMKETFDPAANPLVWSRVQGGVVTNGMSGFAHTNSLYFSGHSARLAETAAMPIASEGYIFFSYRNGHETNNNQGLWDESESNEHVVLEYSARGGPWTAIQSLGIVRGWMHIAFSLPPGAASPETAFRWRQVRHSGEGYDTWAIDNVTVSTSKPEAPSAPVFVLASATSPTSVAVLWSGAFRAASYIIERSSANQPWRMIGESSSADTWFMDADAMPGTEYYYRVKARNAGGASVYSLPAHAMTLTLKGYWLDANAGVTGSDEEKTLLAKDAAGVPYLLRYAFGLDADEPMKALLPGEGQSGKPAIWVDAKRDKLCVEYVRRKASLEPGITYAVQFSSDCVTWETGTNEVSVTSLDSVWERVRVEDRTPCSTNPMRAARVAVMDRE